MECKSSCKKAIIWTVSTLLLGVFVSCLMKILQFSARLPDSSAELLNSPLGALVALMFTIMVFTPMLLRARYHAKQAKLQRLLIILNIFVILCLTISLLFAVGLLIMLIMVLI